MLRANKAHQINRAQAARRRAPSDSAQKGLPMADDAAFANPDVLNASAQGRLRTIIERLERLEEDKQAIMADMKEVFAEAKGEGYDVKTLRKVIRIRKLDKAKRQEEEAILDLYLAALGEI
jgi:uncharacterized protein (UPF0335 family)